MRNWNDFLSEFVLRAMTNREFFEEYSAQHITEFARQAWDAIQAAELPESEKAQNEAMLQDLKKMAAQALEVSNNKAKWFAIDLNGQIWAYYVCPHIEEDRWVSIDDNNHMIGILNTPFDWNIAWKSARYEISKILAQ